MKFNKITLENLFSDYVVKYESKRKSYLINYSLKCYHLRNKNNNTIYRYTIAYGYSCETREMTLKQMILALSESLKTNKPLLTAGI
jgi:hypothetical protein